MKKLQSISLNFNDPQKKTIKNLQDIFPRSHYIDIIVRNNGRDIKFEGDFLKELLNGIKID
jgi:hypothetical protein